MKVMAVVGIVLLAPAPAWADKYDDIWAIAEARVIAGRCPRARVDETVMAGIVSRSHIDLKENADDRELYAFRKQERSDEFWARTEQEMCTRAWIGYGPQGMDVKNLLIFDRRRGK